MKKICLISLCIVLLLTGCGRANRETSFDVISELCKANFAPASEEEYMETYNKYKDTCISESELTKFFDIGKTVHTDVQISNYSCTYNVSGITNVKSYVATMKLTNGSLFTNIKVSFVMNEGKIINTMIEYLAD